jgi:hypothetical protein
MVLRRKILGEKGSQEKDPRRNSFLEQVSQKQFLPGMLFLPRTVLLAVFGREFFPRKTVFSGFSSWE